MVGARKMLQSGQRFINATVSGTSYLPLSGKTWVTPRATGVLQDEGKLPAVRLGVHRHGAQARMPDRVHHLERFDAVGHGDGDAIALGEAVAHAQMRAHDRDLAPERAIAEMGRIAAR